MSTKVFFGRRRVSRSCVVVRPPFAAVAATAAEEVMEGRSTAEAAMRRRLSRRSGLHAAGVSRSRGFMEAERMRGSGFTEPERHTGQVLFGARAFHGAGGGTHAGSFRSVAPAHTLERRSIRSQRHGCRPLWQQLRRPKSNNFAGDYGNYPAVTVTIRRSLRQQLGRQPCLGQLLPWRLRRLRRLGWLSRLGMGRLLALVHRMGPGIGLGVP